MSKKVIEFDDRLEKAEDATRKKYTHYVKTDQGYWGMGNTLDDALDAANYRKKKDTAYVWKGKGIYWKADHIGAVADEWENDGQEVMTLVKGVEYVRMPECPKGRAKAEKASKNK